MFQLRYNKVTDKPYNHCSKSFASVLTVCTCLFLSGCGPMLAYALSTGVSSGKIGTGGTTLGFPMSPMWHGSAPQHVKSRFYNSKSTAQLCNIWAANYPGQKTWSQDREQVGMALKNRGLTEMYCANPNQDEVNVARGIAEAARIEAENAKREAERQKREACFAAIQSYNQCMQNSVGQTSYCSLPPNGC
jgi:hypothetical protein